MLHILQEPALLIKIIRVEDSSYNIEIRKNMKQEALAANMISSIIRNIETNHYLLLLIEDY